MTGECEHCDRELGRHFVTGSLEYGGKHKFCSDRCHVLWMEEQLTRTRRFLNRIFVLCRGKAHDIAHVALHTSEAP